MSLFGLKIVSPNEMVRIEKLAYMDGFLEKDFMQGAANSIFEHIKSLLEEKQLEKNVNILAGKGNNAGDALALARILKENGFNVRVFCLFEYESFSKLLKMHYDVFENCSGKIVYVKKISDVNFLENGIIVDAIFGTGFSNSLTGLIKEVVDFSNQTALLKVSIDIPSGLNGNTGMVQTNAIKADYTVFLKLLKKGFFLEDGPNFIGKLLFGDFGLEEKYVKDAKEDYYFLNEENIFQNFQKILNKRHKYEAGFVTGFAGSIKMDGAAKLASFAALRSGAGIVKIFLPKNMEKVASTFPVEVVKDFTSFDDFEKISKLINKSKAFFIGPGISREKNVENFVTKLLPLIEIPTVIDADALFFLANCENFKIPKFSILTPHRQEMKNLLKITDKISDEELINQAIAYSKEKGIVIVLKGVPTFVIFPNKKPLVVYKGDPGMATAGSGDVLTGIIASLVSQNYDLLNAAVLGVYLHALAGEKAAKDKSSSSMVASDIINELKII